ncbi:N-acetyllactosaminide beta-1,3-N-acetylglucosaminyltransferase 3-like [Leucoraja erinacea]|uniref:N-acetyllactosaminide beta-1,3-N-acetylglucosaminyltransferase 3-like n=1 Tax=Leucoraja erinaceus TaxID=7782 RepID=UPI002458BAF9|nr:N-acetyllactosaminide beta-1,3-N-acetylglucosaminyltransferase 3-like [Leucoraja erinacea]XP_055521896.1 N-acetyllactosaminide beta-1,3-N-acetylglucosaminyltransferase 3-like [Leucoraja erinacea]
MKRSTRLLEKVVLCVLITLGLVFVFWNDGPLQKTDDVVTEAIHHKDLPKLVVEAIKLVVEPKCRENKTFLDQPAFNQQPQHMKNFLQYKHCREFGMIQNVPNKCWGREGSGNVFLLLVVKSDPFNQDRRDMVRKTWGKEREFQGVQIRRVFMSGVSPDQKERKKLNWLLATENREHGDILQWDFLDTFFNLTLKQYKLLQWVDEFCPSARFIFNGDDDVFVNTDNMVHYLLGMNSHQHLYVGHLMLGVGPIREKRSKYYVPEVLTSSNLYPPYISGGGILMSVHTANIIYRIAKNLELFPIDDVFLGMCLAKAGLAPSSHLGFRTAGIEVPSIQDDSFNPCYYRELLLVHRFRPYELLLMWDAVHNASLRCAYSPQRIALEARNRGRW